jgi:spermidine synthase
MATGSLGMEHLIPEVWTELGRAFTPEGDELLLRRRGREFELRTNGQELMASRGHGSEEAMARWACAELANPRSAQVLIGGLGFGYTLRAALDALPPTARIIVTELIPEVVDWVRGPVAELAGNPLDDPRVEVRIEDASLLLRARQGEFDAAILDVDNNPDALVRPANARFFGVEGLLSTKRALTRGGLLAVWSASPAPAFEESLCRAGFTFIARDVPLEQPGRGVGHVVYLARAALPHCGSKQVNRE